MPNPEESKNGRDIPPWEEKFTETGTKYYSRTTLPEIQSQMPDHMDPGSLLHMIRCPLSYSLWLAAKGLHLDKVPKIHNAFYQHINRKHFGGN